MSDENPSKPNLIGRIKDKLIQSKEDWAREGRLLTGRPDMGHVNRLPPGQKEVKNWPVLDLGVQPDIRPEAWRLEVGGLVENPVSWSLDEFLAQPQQDFLSDILKKVLDGATREQIIEDVKAFKEQFKSRPAWEKGKPMRANKLTYYGDLEKKQGKANMPGHVRAAMNWNNLQIGRAHV